MLVAVAGTVAGLLFGGGGKAAVSRARQYTASQACLLTGQGGIADAQAARVWQGMEDASLATRAKVRYLSVAGPATPGNAVPYVNTLVQWHCDLVLAVGAPQTAAVRQVARSAPHMRFIVVDAAEGKTAGNVTALAQSAATRDRVAHLVETAVTGKQA